MENALLGISVDKESPGESPGDVQVRGDDNTGNIILLSCSVKGKKWHHYLPEGCVKSKDEMKISTLLESGKKQILSIWIYFSTLPFAMTFQLDRKCRIFNR